MRNTTDPSPFNALPPAVWFLFAAIALPELAFSMGEAGLVGGPQAIGWRLEALNTYAFSGQAFDFMIGNGVILWEHMLRLVTYPFVSGTFTSTLIGGVIVLAMGKLVGEALGGWAVWLLFMLCSIIGALVMGLLTSQSWLAGAYPGAYGLIGTFTFLYWQKQVATGGAPGQAFMLIGVLMGLQLVFAALSGVAGQTPSYRWVAELTGALTGFGLAAFVVPGGMARLLAALRQR
ncbi:rhomboid family intramembrane serine protease [uncultured Tateyamaria sp.]|uniref:rhomboid family intramembrane serine protease n=1 Tax=Tateyamaria sp. 1078 TaxID=3417464 RepID=UPI00262D4620|nr:rhomboid family intramembrane serine protease [uncultured Tateyamaria sp.]